MSSAPTNRKESSAAAAAASAADKEEKAQSAADPSNKVSKGNDTSFQQYYNQFLQKYPLLQQWKSRKAFLDAQGHFLLVLLVAYCINSWPVRYPREQNHNEFLFWFMTLVVMGGAALTTLKVEKSKRGVQLLSRAQTEEWKGWMQFIFIMVSIFLLQQAIGYFAICCSLCKQFYDFSTTTIAIAVFTMKFVCWSVPMFG